MGECVLQAAGVVLTIFCVGYATIRAASSGQNLAGGAKPSTSLMGNEGGGEVHAQNTGFLASIHFLIHVFICVL